MCRWSGKEVEWNESWPVGRTDKLNGNGLLAARCEAWEEARQYFSPSVLLTYPKEKPCFALEIGRYMRGVDLLELQLSEKIPFR